MAKKKQSTIEEIPIRLPDGVVQNGHNGLEEKGRAPTPPPFFPPMIGQTDAGIEPDFDVIKELMLPGQTSDELDVRTELNTLQVIHLTRARFIARRFRSQAQNRFCDDLERYMISHNRKGRKEVVQSLQSSGMGDAERATGTWGRMMQSMR